MKEPAWVLRATVLTLQEQLLAEFGGSSGIRDEGLLDSALAAGQLTEAAFAAWLKANATRAGSRP